MNPLKLGYTSNPQNTEIYNRIVSMLFMQKERNGINSLLFTGCDRQVGNTTICLSIAVELAKAGKKTVLVDCDFLKQAEQKRLYQHVGAGLTEFLMGEVELDEIIYDTDVPGLSYISSGKNLVNPTMLLWEAGFTDFLKHLTQVCDFVIIDSAPVLAAPEVAVLAYRAAGTLLTVQFGKSLKSQIYAAKKELENAGANILGATVNKTPLSECRIFQKTHGYSIVLRGARENDADV